jgi:hypothetical protein
VFTFSSSHNKRFCVLSRSSAIISLPLTPGKMIEKIDEQNSQLQLEIPHDQVNQ